jgi:hypothetical protein
MYAQECSYREGEEPKEPRRAIGRIGAAEVWYSEIIHVLHRLDPAGSMDVVKLLYCSVSARPVMAGHTASDVRYEMSFPPVRSESSGHVS